MAEGHDELARNVIHDPLPQIVRHSEEIESLKTKILEKDEEILRLNKEVKKLMLENKELNVSLEWKDKKIKQLEDKIEELELDKTDLETKLNSVEAELTTVRKQVTKMKEENKSNQELNATLGENLRKMSKRKWRKLTQKTCILKERSRKYKRFRLGPPSLKTYHRVLLSKR